MIRRILRLAMVGLLIAASWIALTGSPASAGITFQQFNMAMGNSSYHYWANTVVIVDYFVEVGQPLDVSLQEICSGQSIEIATDVNNYTGGGYRGDLFTSTISTGDQTDKSWCANPYNGSTNGRGNFVLARGPEDLYAPPNQVVLTPQADLKEVRKMICIREPGYYFFWRACSLHVTRIAPQKYQQPDTALTFWYNNEVSDLFVIVGGDFNIRPAAQDSMSTSITTWSAFNVESELPTSMSTTDGGEKLDYIWGIRSHVSQASVPTPWPNAYSDHHYVVADFNIM